jgi:hypothetical protein
MTTAASLFEFIGFERIARRAAGFSDANASNSWNSTKYVWECVSDSEQSAVEYWIRVRDEDGEEFAQDEIIAALAWVGKTVSDVVRTMA